MPKRNETKIEDRTYDPGGRLSTSAYGNGVVTTWTWRDDGSTKRDNQVASIDIANGASTIDSFAYTFDENKNVTVETRGGVMVGYGWTTDNAGSSGFDPEDRLTYWKRSDNKLTQNWTLSLVGDWNAFASQGTSQSRAHGPTHELTSVTVGNNTDAVQHDVKGNVTFIPGVLSAIGSEVALSWDFDNRLVGANTDGQPGDEVTFQYDARGRRVSKTVNGSTTVFVHGGRQILADYPLAAAPNAPAEKYVYASYIDEPILKDGTLAGGTGLAYYHHDRRYTITALTDSTASAVERYAYSPYGSLTILDGSGSAIASSQTANRYTYTGRECDSETNLYHFRARLYSPTLGRFLTRDPLGFVDGLSLYRAYFIPGGVDPFGLLTIQDSDEKTRDGNGDPLIRPRSYVEPEFSVPIKSDCCDGTLSVTIDVLLERWRKPRNRREMPWQPFGPRQTASGFIEFDFKSNNETCDCRFIQFAHSHLVVNDHWQAEDLELGPKGLPMIPTKGGHVVPLNRPTVDGNPWYDRSGASNHFPNQIEVFDNPTVPEWLLFGKFRRGATVRSEFHGQMFLVCNNSVQYRVAYRKICRLDPFVRGGFQNRLDSGITCEYRIISHGKASRFDRPFHGSGKWLGGYERDGETPIFYDNPVFNAGEGN